MATKSPIKRRRGKVFTGYMLKRSTAAAVKKLARKRELTNSDVVETALAEYL